MDLTALTAAQLAEAIRRRDVSGVEVARAFLDRIAAHDAAIGAFVTVDAEGALAQARRVDERIAAGDDVGPLAGVPVALKDLLSTRGLRTTCASKILEHFVPPYDAFVVGRLRQADAVLVGKTNLDEFAMGSSTENSGLKPTRNPWDLGRIPGGSSGGSAAAVAASMAPLALGSDTGGSIRQPGALCGVIGFKPTYGLVSRYGLVAFASSLDQIGPFAWTVEDTALVLETIAGHDPADSTSVDGRVSSYSETFRRPIEGLRIGLAKEHFGEGLDPEVDRVIREAVAVYETLGATVTDVSLPHSDYGVAVYYIVATAEASSNLARYDGVHYGHRAAAFDDTIDMVSRSRAEGFGDEVKRRIMLGAYVLSSGYYDAYYRRAMKVRRLIRNDYDEVFADVDCIMGPTSPTPAFAFGEKVDNPLAMYLSDIYTIPANLTGTAAASIPCGFTADGLPVGLQIQVPPFEEERLLRIAQMLQEATDHHTRRPTLEGEGGSWPTTS